MGGEESLLGGWAGVSRVSLEGLGEGPAALCAGRAGLGESRVVWSGLVWSLLGTGDRAFWSPVPSCNAPVSLLFQSRKGADPERDKKVPECKADSIGSGRAIPMKQVRCSPFAPL